MGHFLPPTTNHLWWTDGATTMVVAPPLVSPTTNHLWCSPKAMANTLYVVGGRTRTLVHQRWLPPLQTVEANTFYLVGDHLWCSPPEGGGDLMVRKEKRRHPDLNWGIKDLQSSALPLGYAAILLKVKVFRV